MARHKQESIADWAEYARDRAKAERELRIEHWVRVTIGYVGENRETVALHLYDLPREVLERRKWVVRWRTARLQCRHPRRLISTWYGYYDRRTGLKTDFKTSLGRLVSAKAQITKARRCIEQHIAEQKALYPLFYDESTDTELVAYREKLAQKIENCRLAEENIRLAVEKHRRGLTQD